MVKRLNEQPAWLALSRHRRVMAELPLRGLFERDPHRFERFSLELEDLLLDYSKNRISGETLELLFALARQCALEERREQLFAGKPVNVTEGRAALHTALRDPGPGFGPAAGGDLARQIGECNSRMQELVADVRAGRYRGATGEPITDVVNLGIGGSDLGPRLAVEALARPADGPCVHFVANVEGSELAEVFRRCNPQRTLFLVVSKSFATAETLSNAAQAAQWCRSALGETKDWQRHFIAITANFERARAFGLQPAAVLPIWDWVGGRYSLWSAVGLAAAMAIGMERFRELLAGAHAMDRHFRQAPLGENIPVVLGLLDVWYVTFLGVRALAIIAYTERLRRLPAYLQQLIMESNGKSVTLDGPAVAWPTAPVIWGLTGTPAQHAFFQALHQGTEMIPVDFIGVVGRVAERAGDSAQAMANLIAQSQALMRGRSAEESRAQLEREGLECRRIDALVPHRVCPGGRPSNCILLRELTPRSLGMLLAMYEHRTFVQSVIWGINGFDQWGVELGKQIAAELGPVLAGHGSVMPDIDSSSRGLIRRFRDWSSD